MSYPTCSSNIKAIAPRARTRRATRLPPSKLTFVNRSLSHDECSAYCWSDHHRASRCRFGFGPSLGLLASMICSVFQLSPARFKSFDICRNISRRVGRTQPRTQCPNLMACPISTTTGKTQTTTECPTCSTTTDSDTCMSVYLSGCLPWPPMYSMLKCEFAVRSRQARQA